jgi:hypothetical protein
MVGEMPVERSAQLILLLLYLDRRGRPKVRIHGRPRSDRKRRFLLSAVAPSTSTRHPREARPGHSAVGLRQGGEMSPDAEATFHRAIMHAVTRWFVLRTALLFVRNAVRLVYAELPGRPAVCSPKQALCELGDRVLGGDRIVEYRRVPRAPPPHRSLPPEPPRMRCSARAPHRGTRPSRRPAWLPGGGAVRQRPELACAAMADWAGERVGLAFIPPGPTATSSRSTAGSATNASTSTCSGR